MISVVVFSLGLYVCYMMYYLWRIHKFSFGVMASVSL